MADAADAADARAAGAIYDLGYQPYTGPRFGRWYAVRTLISYSFATVFGVGRGDKAKTIPTLIVALVYLPALVQVGVASATGVAALIQYSTYLEFTAFLIALFAAAQAPELIVTDKQQGVLSLYLSRPLKATDYAAAKLVALVLAMLVITLGPQLLLLLGRIFLGDLVEGSEEMRQLQRPGGASDSGQHQELFVAQLRFAQGAGHGQALERRLLGIKLLD